MDMNFMDFRSNWIWPVQLNFKSTSSLFTDAIRAPFWCGSFERIKFGPCEEEQSRSCSLCN